MTERIKLLHMESVVYHICIIENLSGDKHHRRRQIAGYLFDSASDMLAHRGQKCRYNLSTLSSRYGGCQSAFAAMAVFVGQEGPYFTVAQTRLVKAHVRTDVGGIEVEPGAEIFSTPTMITA